MSELSLCAKLRLLITALQHAPGELQPHVAVSWYFPHLTKLSKAVAVPSGNDLELEVLFDGGRATAHGTYSPYSKTLIASEWSHAARRAAQELNFAEESVPGGFNLPQIRRTAIKVRETV